MAHLATVASHQVNGVAPLHSRLLRETCCRDFADMYPDRFTNVTNGVTPRRFLALANPGLAAPDRRRHRDGWVCDLDRLAALEPLAEDPASGSSGGRSSAQQADAVRLAGCPPR